MMLGLGNHVNSDKKVIRLLLAKSLCKGPP